MAKRVIRLFGFSTHEAPGEAEAECALLQRKGIVDVVLSEDVDTIMFGCGRTLRNWSAEGTKCKTPTHVTMYDAKKVASGASGLDREGMVLVALMSGGDYLPEGVPGCGVKVACEAARAGFGRDLCRIKVSDTAALVSWKERLQEELRTNKSKHFRTKHKALAIPEHFPNLEVLRYYTHPVVSREEKLDRIKQNFLAQREVDVVGLREFVAGTFDWTNRMGAVKFIRVISAQILVQRLVRRCGTAEVDDDLDLKEEQEAAFVKSVTKRREHFSTDATPELRISYIPVDIVGIDLDAEPEDEVQDYGRQALALNSDDEFGCEADEDGEQTKSGGGKKSFDPTKPDLIWVPESLLQMSVPLTVENWKDKQRAKELKAAAPKAKRTTHSKKTDMPVGALDQFVKVTKRVSSTKPTASQEPARNPLLSEPPSSPASSAPPITASKSSALLALAQPAPRSSASKGRLGSGKGKQVKASSKAQPSKPTAQVTPWTIASSQASHNFARSTVALVASKANENSQRDHILISSSPLAPSPTSSHRRNVEPATQGTPTRRGKRHSSPSIDKIDEGDPASPTISSMGAVATQRNTNPSSARASPEPVRRARPFKRTKSGAESEPQSAVAKASTASRAQAPIKNTQVLSKASTQMSIRIFGRISRNNPLTSLETQRPQLAIPIDPFTGDEEGEDGECVPLSPSPRGSLRARASKGSSPSLEDNPGPRGGYISDDDEPFGPATSTTSSGAPTRSSSSIPQSNRTSSPCSSPTGEKSEIGKSSKEPLIKSNPTLGMTKTFTPHTTSHEADIFGGIKAPCEKPDRLLGGSETGRAAFKTSLNVRSGGRTWRMSEVSIIDLTGED
jgi:holliday junction resolvase YEN1